MLLNDAVKQVKSGSVTPGIIVLCGDEPYIRSFGIQKLIEASDTLLPEMNVSVFDGRPPIEELKIALERCPFMSRTKVVVLRETDLLSSDAPTAQAKHLENLRLDDGTLFIISAPGKLDRRKGYVKQLLSSAIIVNCDPLQGAAMTRFIAGEAKRRRLSIGNVPAEALAERTQGDLNAIVSELDKLASVCTGQITIGDIERYVPESEELNMFRIYDSLAAGKHKQAFREVMHLVSEDANPIGFVTFLANTFRQMLVARACRDARFSDRKTIECVCEETGAKEWAARRAFQHCTRFTASKLRDNVQLLASVDFGAKQGMYELERDLYPILERLFSP